MIKICTERSKTSVLVSVFNAESGEKTFKAIINFFETPIVKILVENMVFDTLGFCGIFRFPVGRLFFI